MATLREEYFTEMLNSLLKHYHRHGTPLSGKNTQEAFKRVMEEEENYAERNVNIVTKYFVSVPFHYKFTKERCKRDK